MRPRSVQTTPTSGTKKSRAGYGEDVSLQRRDAAPSAKIISPDKIAERAYSIWEREGQPEGHDQEFWFRAEAELTNEQSAQAKF